VGDGRLGGISSTLSALESLILRGYDVHGIVFIQDPSSTDKDFSYSNHLALREYASRKLKLRSGLGKVLLEDPEKSIISLPSLPPLPHPLDPWFQGDETREKFESFHQLLTTRWNQYLQEVYEMRSVGKDMIWWPFTQHGKYTSKNFKETKESSITLIDAAQGDYFHVLDQDTFEQDDKISFQRRALFDGCASWWTQGLGHGNSSLALAAAAAAGRYGHVIFPDVVHSPAVSLWYVEIFIYNRKNTVLHFSFGARSKLLLGPKGPGHEWASRVFFSDDGSTAMEIALKMGLRKFCVDRNIDIKMANTSNVTLSICAQKGCYHGDTLGVMHVAESNIFNIGQHPWYEAKGLFLDFPIVRFRNGILEVAFPDGSIDESPFNNIASIYDVETRLSTDLYLLYYDSILKAWDDFEQMSPSRSVHAPSKQTFMYIFPFKYILYFSLQADRVRYR
jgi:dethiobiotin synthetase/adenosylmethionine--8-amino-7-oxononanoate aminotransferase